MLEIEFGYGVLLLLTLWGVWALIILAFIRSLEFLLELFEQW